MTSVVFLATAVLLLHTVRTQHYQRNKKPTVWEKSKCQEEYRHGPRGTISSPGYPKRYSNHTSCTWHIVGNKSDNITINFDDLDIEEDSACEKRPCCNDNWLKIGFPSDGEQQKYCGRGIIPPPLVIASSDVLVKFHSSRSAKGGRGFQFLYTIGRCLVGEAKCGNIDECYMFESERCNGIWDCSNGVDEVGCGIIKNVCSDGFLSCHSGTQCYPAEKQCDGTTDCSDLSDELDCNYCGINKTRCGSHSSQCFDLYTQKCNRVVDCLNGEDERGCLGCQKDEILCSSGQGCYSVAERCNGIAQCGDYSDEKDCGPELCKSNHGGFLCGNGHCIKEVWKCDRTNDCGDGTDEENCLKNSVISAAVMGSLICGLLLVIAISCTCRLYSLRFVEQQVSNRETPLSRLTQEFLYREPPPSYAMATGQQTQNLCVESLHYEIEARHHRQRSRRSRHSRRRSSTPSSPLHTANQGAAIMQTPSIESCNSGAFPESSQSDNSLATAVSFISNSDSDIDSNSPNQRKDEKLDSLSSPVLMERESTKTTDIQDRGENELSDVGNRLSVRTSPRVQDTSDIHIDLNVLSIYQSSESLHPENTANDHDMQPLIIE